MAETPTPYISVNPDGSFEAPSEPGTYPLHIPFELLHPAPAAPSVGEPTSHDDAQFIKMAMIGQSSLDMVFALLEQKAEIATALGIDPVESSHNDILAQCAALRSSLEEARKDSERLAEIRALLREMFTLRKTDYRFATHGEFSQARKRLDAVMQKLAGHVPPRAPSPRDEP